MKLHFDSNLEYQLNAISAVCDLFNGQETCHTEFTVTKSALDGQFLPGFDSELGIGNRLLLLKEEIIKNLSEVQMRNGMIPTTATELPRDFTIEMETGTGKTYVYLRTIFELNKRFGFSKFVIVVPSVAIREGVYHSLEITADHFRNLYANVPYDYFVYDSSKLGQVRNFATSNQIQIMVVTVGAINKKDVNNLYKDSEKTGGEKPIDLIRATRPILIVDEPQSVEGGLQGAGRSALEAMNPLCTLRYSATHSNKYEMVYRLDAVDAYMKRLVKQIEVASAEIEGSHNKPYVKLISVGVKRGSVKAKIELDVRDGTGVKRKELEVSDGDDLQEITKRAIYENMRIGEIRASQGTKCIELKTPGTEQFLRIGESFGDIDMLAVHRQMIRRTIEEHLKKEKRLRPRGIKVLSLFFIDKVENYRKYDEQGEPVKGVFAEIFEQEYRRLAVHPDYKTLFEEVDLSRSAGEVHDGYFSIDKKKVGNKTVETFKDSKEDATTKADEDTYSLIMKEKEKLLSFETPLKFIFSHSALREGWDNPNVFQICALRDIQTEMERRQTIGRGLRLCVNQQGERLQGFEVNTLTVVAKESYKDFAEKLQKEIEDSTGRKFGYVEPHHFTFVSMFNDEGSVERFGPERSREVFNFLKQEGYISTDGKIQDSLRTVLKTGRLVLPEAFQQQRGQIAAILEKFAGSLEVKDADKGRPINVRREVFIGPEFRDLWDRIKYKTTYRVGFDNQELIRKCIRALANGPAISRTRLHWRKADISIEKSGVEATEKEGASTINLEELDIELPDVLTELQDRTRLTRRSICEILKESGRLQDFTKNPQEFMEIATEAINRTKRLVLVDGIKYQTIGNESYYAQELFETEELKGYLNNMLENTKKSVFEHVVYDSAVEAEFATQLEHNSMVKVYAKLPSWFKVPTPLGTYNPDWAVLIEKDGVERLYFVVETKSSLYNDDLRDREGAKIECGKAHFKALAEESTPVKFVRASKLNEVLNQI